MGIKTKVKRVLRNRNLAKVPRVREPGKGDWPDEGGVREPRRPKDQPPADAMQLPEPK